MTLLNLLISLTWSIEFPSKIWFFFKKIKSDNSSKNKCTYYPFLNGSDNFKSKKQVGNFKAIISMSWGLGEAKNRQVICGAKGVTRERFTYVVLCIINAHNYNIIYI